MRRLRILCCVENEVLGYRMAQRVLGLKGFLQLLNQIVVQHINSENTDAPIIHQSYQTHVPMVEE